MSKVPGLLLVVALARVVHGDVVTTLPPALDRTVDFASEVAPLLRERCASCHGRGKSEGDFQIDQRESFLQGGVSGDAIVIGDSSDSYLIELVAGVDPDNIMPEKGKRLNAEEVGLLRAWIDQGAVWDPEVTFEKPAPLNLKPGSEPPPAVPGLDHPIDRWLAVHFEHNGISPGGSIDDAQFARRSSLDALGVVPSEARLKAFLADDHPDKRGAWVDSLLADRVHYASHWMAFWNDLLRNDYSGTGFIDGGRRQITAWLWDALASNKPYDRFVRELVAPVSGSEGFTKGIVWRGVVNASQRPEMQAAQSISQVFLGVNLKCASCHNSFIDDWRLEDAYGMASVYSEEPLTIVECDKPTDEVAEASFLFPSLGPIALDLDKEERAARLAALMTARENGRTPRTLVNRVWARFFGRGLVEPLDSMDSPSWAPGLLDWLAEGFVQSGYDVRWLMREIMTSDAYALEASPHDTEANEEWVFRGPIAKRLGAEAFWDNLDRLTGLQREFPTNRDIDFFAGLSPEERQARLPETLREAQVVSSGVETLDSYWFRLDLEFGGTIKEVMALAAGNAEAKFFFDGNPMGSLGKDRVGMLMTTKEFASGSKHVVGVEMKRKEGEEAPDPLAFWGYFRILGSDGDRLEFATVGGGWRGRGEATSDWAAIEAKSEGWSVPVLSGDTYREIPWVNGKRVETLISQLAYRGTVRAALVNNDPLMLTLGRTNREQVITRREEVPTTLQALALTNGETFIQRLRRGAARWFEREGQTEPEMFARSSFFQALSREPNDDELALALEILGAELSLASVEDWLWTLLNLPEFQFVY